MPVALQRSTRFYATLTISSVVCVGLVWGALYWKDVGKETRQASRDLLTLMELRSSALKKYLSTIRSEAVLWSSHERIQTAFLEFSDAWKGLGKDQERVLKKFYIEDNPHPVGKKHRLDDAKDGSAYSKVHARRHPWLRRFLEYHGYYDVFLFDRDGNLIYTTFKESDFTTNLATGRWKGSGLGKVFRTARAAKIPDFVAFQDFASYGPSQDAPASFVASPIFTDGVPVGVFALQVPADRIEKVMQFTAGMGETGETYLVGRDLLMRSDSRFSEESTILRTTVDTETVHLALQGESGVQITPDYRGIRVLSAYGPLKFEGVTWAVMAEIDEAEIKERFFDLRKVIITGILAAASVGIVVVVLLMFLLGRAEKPAPWTEPD